MVWGSVIQDSNSSVHILAGGRLHPSAKLLPLNWEKIMKTSIPGRKVFWLKLWQWFLPWPWANHLAVPQFPPLENMISNLIVWRFTMSLWGEEGGRFIVFVRCYRNAKFYRLSFWKKFSPHAPVFWESGAQQTPLSMAFNTGSSLQASLRHSWAVPSVLTVQALWLLC